MPDDDPPIEPEITSTDDPSIEPAETGRGENPLIEPVESGPIDEPSIEPAEIRWAAGTAMVSTSSTSGGGETSGETASTSGSASRIQSWLWPLAGLALTVHLLGLYLPGSPDGGFELPWLPGADKVVHLLLFAVPVYLLGRLTRRVGLVAGAFAVHAVVSELVQSWFLPYRDGDPFDALADLVGIGLAVLLLRRQRSGR